MHDFVYSLAQSFAITTWISWVGAMVVYAANWEMDDIVERNDVIRILLFFVPIFTALFLAIYYG